MTREEIVKIVNESILENLPSLSMEQIVPEQSLRQIGANSIDRIDILLQCVEMTGIKIPMIEFANIESIHELVNLLYEKQTIYK